MCQVSVIIPIYKVERFIARCAESLFSQTLQEVEYVFVNDATPDDSMAVLQSAIEKYPHRKKQIKILTHEQNKGLPAARNSGLAVATGEYIFHCDSDDFVEIDMLQSLYDKAVAESADIVWCDWYLSFEKNERYMAQPNYQTPMDALKAMLSGGMKYNVWNKLVKRSLYADNHIEFPAGYGMGEDMTMMILFACAQKVSYFPRAFYHYVKLNTGAFSQTYSDRHLTELRHNVQRINHFMQNRFGAQLEQELSFFKLEAKFPFLFIVPHEKFHLLWREWYPEANRYIMQNENISMRSRLVQWCASKNLFMIVRLYFGVINRVLYGFLYK